MVEASHAFGASESQTLLKVQIPLAMPTIMAGVNQTIMMSLAMTVVASMISVTGLGQMVLRGIGRLDMNIATVGGLGIVLLAIVVDRFSQGFAVSSRERGHRKWYQRGPIGVIYQVGSRIQSNYATPEDVPAGADA
jgi:glycine betaine/proline transport system permease protein